MQQFTSPQVSNGVIRATQYLCTIASIHLLLHPVLPVVTPVIVANTGVVVWVTQPKDEGGCLRVVSECYVQRGPKAARRYQDGIATQHGGGGSQQQGTTAACTVRVRWTTITHHSNQMQSKYITSSDEAAASINILRTGPNSVHAALGCHDWQTTSGIKSKVRSITADG